MFTKILEALPFRTPDDWCTDIDRLLRRFKTLRSSRIFWSKEMNQDIFELQDPEHWIRVSIKYDNLNQKVNLEITTYQEPPLLTFCNGICEFG